MSKRFRHILCIACALAVTGPAWAFDPPTPAEPPAPRDARETRDLRDSVRRVERDIGGSVLRAERVHGREVNRVKVLTPEGRVRVVHERNERPREVERPQRRNPRGRDD